MIPARWKILCLLMALVLLSYWWQRRLSGEAESAANLAAQPSPDAYMRGASTLILGLDGEPRSKLYADYMEYHAADGATTLLNPKLELLRPDAPPIVITAEHGRMYENDELVELSGNTRLIQRDSAGANELEILTSEVRLLMEQRRAETNKPATGSSKNMIINAVGVNAFLDEDRLELLNDANTRILPGPFTETTP